MDVFLGLVDFWGKRWMYFVSVAFIAFGAFFSILSGDMEWLLLAGGWGLFLMIILLLMDIPFFNFYIIHNKRIIVVRMGFIGFLRFDKIADIRKIDWKDIKKFGEDEWIKMTVVRYNEQKYGGDYTMKHMDEIIPSLKSIWRYNRLVSWCTAAPSIRVCGGKSEVFVKKAEYILLTMIDGKQYAISPKDPDEFIKHVQLTNN